MSLSPLSWTERRQGLRPCQVIDQASAHELPALLGQVDTLCTTPQGIGMGGGVHPGSTSPLASKSVGAVSAPLPHGIWEAWTSAAMLCRVRIMPSSGSWAWLFVCLQIVHSRSIVRTEQRPSQTKFCNALAAGSGNPFTAPKISVLGILGKLQLHHRLVPAAECNMIGQGTCLSVAWSEQQETVTDDAARATAASLTRGFFTARDNGWIETHGMPSTTASMAFSLALSSCSPSGGASAGCVPCGSSMDCNWPNMPSTCRTSWPYGSNSGCPAVRMS
jgi:hypothetical protein